MVGVAIVVAFLLVYGALKAVVIVPNGSAYVIERLGRYRATLPPGFNIIMPILDHIAYKHALTQQTEELSDVYETKDRRRATLAAAFQFRVLDAQRASYGTADYRDSLRVLMRTSQKHYVAGQTWDSLRQDSRSLESEVLRNADALAETIGVKVLEYTVRDLQLAD
jgi:regulator of protease activity HflC (stomatin/prohibitin superfamily)